MLISSYWNRERAARYVLKLKGIAQFCSYRDPLEGFTSDLAVVTLPRGYAIYAVNDDGTLHQPALQTLWFFVDGEASRAA